MQPRYTTFVEAAFAISNDYERGLIDDLSDFDIWCQAMADGIASKKVDLNAIQIKIEIPKVIQKAYNALLNGIMAKIDEYPFVPTDEGCEATPP